MRAALLCLFVSCCMASGQSVSSFYGAGVSLLPQSSPKPMGNAFIAAWSNATGSLINIEEIDFTWVPTTKSISTAIVASAATPVTMLGQTFYGFVGAGGATGASSSAAFSAGGFAAFPFKGIWVFPGAKLLKTAAGGYQTIAFIDIGRKK